MREVTPAAMVQILNGGIPAEEAGGLPGVSEMVRQLSEEAGIPEPQVFLLRFDDLNAISTGFSRYDAAIGVSEGLIRRMEPSEVRAIVAHEIGHIVHDDVAESTSELVEAMQDVYGLALASIGVSVLADLTSSLLDDFVGGFGLVSSLVLANRKRNKLKRSSHARELRADHYAISCGLGPWLDGAFRKMARAEPLCPRPTPGWLAPALTWNVAPGSTHPSTAERLSHIQPRDVRQVHTCWRCGLPALQPGACGGCGSQPRSRHCQECGAPAHHSAVFCRACGTGLTMCPCPGCGTQSMIERPFCATCGFALP